MQRFLSSLTRTLDRLAAVWDLISVRKHPYFMVCTFFLAIIYAPFAWISADYSWLFAALAVLALAFLVGSTIYRISPRIALLISTFCVTQPMFLNFTRTEPDLIYSLLLLCGAMIVFLRTTVGPLAALIGAALAVSSSVLNPPFALFLPFLPLLPGRDTPMKSRLLILCGPLLVATIATVRLLRGTLHSFLAIHGLDSSTLTFWQSLELSYWREASSSPSFYLFVFLAFHGVLRGREIAAHFRPASYALVGGALFFIGPLLYLTSRELNYTCYLFPALIMSLPAVGLGLFALLNDFTNNRPKNAARAVALLGIIIVWIQGVLSLRNQLITLYLL